MSDPSPRYVTLYQRTGGANTGGTNDYHGFVLDRWYCHREIVHVRLPISSRGTVRGICEKYAREWNAAHDAWLGEAPEAAREPVAS